MDQSTLGKPLRAYPRSFGHEMISKPTSPANEDHPISENEYSRVIPTNVDASLCKYCPMLAVDVLSDSVASSTGWETVRSPYFSLSYLKEHQVGTVGSLLQSAKGGCELCALMAEVFRKVNGNTDMDQALSGYRFPKSANSA